MNMKGTLVLWLAGMGIPAEPIFADERVKFELAQKRPDPKGVMDAIQSASYSIPEINREDRENLFKPQYQLELLSLVESGGQEMVLFGV